MLGAANAEGGKAGDRERDLAAIEKICGATWEPLYRFIYHKVYNREEAEDITQETYVKALPRFKDGSVRADKYGSYLRTVALNVLRDRWRKNKRRGASVNLEDLSLEDEAAEDPAEASVQKEAVREALSKLGEHYRRVVEFRILKGYSVAETAKVMGETESNIRVLQYRALQTLSALLSVTD
ncbi:MAG TPA: sigma-70 family RNA polymerase sigma factor [Oscillospiraceae bacterium]|nr:sigma-70 family RNA polymerase sigma factor [Oscillospiraceae bacterium]HNW04334.1 sigma-70 family RNA polymerase sigma factor [Oscillospiraceae bacterium]HPW00273.1 sigma-70 family RNA polymerase sigma factor [Oscillospiraceae bacterium]